MYFWNQIWHPFFCITSMFWDKLHFCQIMFNFLHGNGVVYIRVIDSLMLHVKMNMCDNIVCTCSKNCKTFLPNTLSSKGLTVRHFTERKLFPNTCILIYCAWRAKNVNKLKRQNFAETSVWAVVHQNTSSSSPRLYRCKTIVLCCKERERVIASEKKYTEPYQWANKIVFGIQLWSTELYSIFLTVPLV